MKYTILLLVFTAIASCSNPKSYHLKEGNWKLSFLLQEKENIKAPITTVVKNGNWNIKNALEVIKVSDIKIVKDSIFIRPPFFEGYFAGQFIDADKITGNFIKPNMEQSVPFVLEYGNPERFVLQSFTKETPAAPLDRIWEITFSPNTIDEYAARGVFKQQGSQVTGTFETTTGDYRYLEGIIQNDSLHLSTFDGAHLFLFKAFIKDKIINGVFYSGNHWEEPFIGKVNHDYELPDPNTLTFIKEGYNGLSFSFPNNDGELVSLNDSIFDDKVVIVQLMGSWCPNCLDETRFYVEYLKNEQPKDVQFVALAFEYAPSEEKAYAAIARLQQSLELSYPILLAQYGGVDKTAAQEKLPMLNKVLSYPTTIYLDKNKKVKRIHTGYNGPATGPKYDRFKEEFYSYVEELRQ